MKKTLVLICAVVIFLTTTGYNVKKEHLISGKTMGTTYHIKVLAGVFESISDLKDQIDERLRAVNQSMSTYIGESEISRFNSFRQEREPFPVSDDFFRVVTAGQKLHRLTQGAWDGTVNPLVNLWGFGVSEKKDPIPNDREIKALLEDVGFEHIEISDKKYLVKRRANVTLDFGSIAKGYAVDEVANLLKERGIGNYLVEIGGEIFASGTRNDGAPWRLGINMPKIDAPKDQIYGVVSLSGKALATSGNYRNFFVKNGIRYSHIIDPRTGLPVKSCVVSASVLANDCLLADGLATALVVLSPQNGIALINRLSNVECLILCEEKDGALKEYASDGFHPFRRR